MFENKGPNVNKTICMPVNKSDEKIVGYVVRQLKEGNTLIPNMREDETRPTLSPCIIGLLSECGTVIGWMQEDNRNKS
jgi:hypothetical protein